MGDSEAMRRALIDPEFAAWDFFGHLPPGDVDPVDHVVVAVNDQRRQVTARS